MYTVFSRVRAANLHADRSAIFFAVVVFHLALAYAFYAGLNAGFIKKLFTPGPLTPVVLPREAPRPSNTVATNIRNFLSLPQPEVPTPDGLRVEAAPESVIEPGAGPLDTAPAHVPVVTAIGADPLHPLKIGADYYPRSAVILGQEGRCVVNVTVAVNGHIVESSLLKSSGFRALDEACINAVRGQRMRPATEDGKPVSSRASIPIVWKLDNR